MPKRLFSTKPIGELHEADDANELKRTLDARALVLLGIGAVRESGADDRADTEQHQRAGVERPVQFVAGVGFVEFPHGLRGEQALRHADRSSGFS